MLNTFYINKILIINFHYSI